MTAIAKPQSMSVRAGIAWMTLSSVFYAMTYVTVRELGKTFPAVEISFFRAAIGTLVMLPWLMRAGLVSLRTDRKTLYGVRAIVTYSGMVCWFYALTHMPLADATALMFTAPLFTVIILARREPVGINRWIAIALGFAGALVIIRPGVVEVGLAAGAALYTAIAYGGANAATRALTVTEDTNAVVFYQFALVLPLAVLATAFDWRTPAWADLPMIFAFGVLSVLAMQTMTRGLAAAEAGVVMPLFYLQLPFVGLMAYPLYGEVPEIWVWVGSAVICYSAYYIARTERRGRT